ncbi:MAG TPA: hypothetical protein VEX37_03390, partial [Thermomicrobiales bacterium]|nr:hypothetical protein [Thermomicrobiales bacterium]
SLMFDHPTIEALAVNLLARLDPQPVVQDVVAVHAAGPAPAVLGTAAVSAMSDEQIEALLLERLGNP